MKITTDIVEVYLSDNSNYAIFTNRIIYVKYLLVDQCRVYFSTNDFLDINLSQQAFMKLASN